MSAAARPARAPSIRSAGGAPPSPGAPPSAPAGAPPGAVHGRGQAFGPPGLPGAPPSPSPVRDAKKRAEARAFEAEEAKADAASAPGLDPAPYLARLRGLADELARAATAAVPAAAAQLPVARLAELLEDARTVGLHELARALAPLVDRLRGALAAADLPTVVAEVVTALRALVTDAGSPGISDPGERIVRAALAADCRVEPVPGPCALVAALTASGLPTDEFHFVGFLPHKSGQRRTELERLRGLPGTLVLYESPHRIPRLLGELAELLPEREVVLARELTKKFEEFLRGRPAELVAATQNRALKGEFVVLVRSC
ncbi:MAG: rRNA small subunit methyltransferase 1 [Kofleriaceae bacterium]|nr:rRNA small subunit methyltransferase 1 [Kofleriaceae bacterium]